MANLTVQLVSKSTRLPVKGIKVALRSARLGVDYDNVTDSDGMADFMMVEPGPAEFLVAEAVKAEIDIRPDSNMKMFGGTPVLVEI